MVRLDGVEGTRGPGNDGLGLHDRSRGAKMPIQSMMFSSTWQILDYYVDDLPAEAPSIPGDIDRQERSSPEPARSAINQLKPLPDFPESPERSPDPSDLDSTTRSPASSQTSAFSDEVSVKSPPVKEIRRRRSPEGAEPRPKNLLLTKSNGATNPPLKLITPISATSNYDKSPALESPPDLPPPPPPKMFERMVQRVPVPVRKPVQTPPALRPAKPVASTDQVSKVQREKSAAEKKAAVSGGVSNFQIALRLPQKPAISTFSTSKAIPEAPRLQTIPPRIDSLPKGAANFPNPKQGLRPAHKKSLGSFSQNKDLPPSPRSFKNLPSLPSKAHDEVGFPQDVYELSSLPSARIPSASHSRMKSNTTLAIIQSLRAASPLADSLQQNDESAYPKPEQAPPGNSLQPKLSARARPGGRGPRLAPTVAEPTSSPVKASMQQSSLSSLTSSSLAAPFSQPNFQSRGRLATDSDFRSRSRSRSRSNGSQVDQSKISQPQRPPFSASSRTLSSESVNSSKQHLDVPSRPHTSQGSHLPPPQPSMSSLPSVPEDRSPLVAPELKEGHFTCYTQHRSMLVSSNALAPILCMTCKTDSKQMWKCGWCCLRVCGGCKNALGEVKGNLKRMLAEHERGSLKIGKERGIEITPIERSTTPASVLSSRSDSSSQMRVGRGMSPWQPQGQLPFSLAIGQNGGPFSVGPPAAPFMRSPATQSIPARPQAAYNRSDFLFDQMLPSNSGSLRIENIGPPLPPAGPQRSFAPPYGNIPIGITMNNDMRRPMDYPPRFPNQPRKSPMDLRNGDIPPDFDLGIDAGPGAMAAGMRGLNPNMPGTTKLPLNPSMGVGIGGLSNGRPRPQRNRMLMI